MSGAMLADGPLDAVGVQQYADDAGKGEWVEEEGPRGGRRWRRGDQVTYKDPMRAARRAQSGAPKDPKRAGSQLAELERRLNLATMQDEPPAFPRDSRLPGAGKDPDDIGFGVPDLPKEPAAVDHRDFQGNTEGFQKAKSQQLRQLSHYITHALPLMLSKMTKQDVKAWAAKRGLDSPILDKMPRKDVAKHLATKAIGMANTMDMMRQELGKYQSQEVEKIKQRTEAAMRKAPDIKIGDIEFREDLVPDEPQEIKKQSATLAEVLVGMPFGDELEEAMDDLAGFSFGRLMEKYGAMGPLIAGAGLLGGSVGGLAGGAIGSLPLAAIIGGGSIIGTSVMGLDPLTSLIGNAAVTGYLLSQPKWTHEQEDAWEKEHPALADSVTVPPFVPASMDKAAAGLIPKATKGGASMGAGWAMMPFVGLARALRSITGSSKPYARQESISAMQLKHLAKEFMEEYLDGFHESMAEYMQDHATDDGLANGPLEMTT